MTKAELQRERANANETLNNIAAYVDVHLGKIDNSTRLFLIEDAEGAFNQYFACAEAQGLPISSITARRAAEHYLIGCINKHWKITDGSPTRVVNHK